jgi:hypothetical protein
MMPFLASNMAAAHTFEIRLNLLIYSKYNIEILKLKFKKIFSFCRLWTLKHVPRTFSNILLEIYVII